MGRIHGNGRIGGKMPNLLDATLRDGSFLIKYQFTLDHVKKIVAGLDQAGVNYIEVANGNGIGAEDLYPQFKGLHTDLEHVKTAREQIHGKTKLGVIAGSCVTKDEHLAPLWEYIDFVRLSINLKDLKGVDSFVSSIKKRGKEAFIQLVRSSMLSTKELLDIIHKIKDFGADVIYVVDSGGFMKPEETFKRVLLVKNESKLPVGFHGHNNFQLAVANTLAALRAGADFVDGCLHTMGKGAGNAQTEILAHFMNEGYSSSFNTELLIKTAKEEIFPLLKNTSMGVSAYELQSALRGTDFPREALDPIQDVTKASEEEILDAVCTMPNLVLNPTEEEFKTLVQNIYKKKNLKTCA